MIKTHSFFIISAFLLLASCRQQPQHQGETVRVLDLQRNPSNISLKLPAGWSPISDTPMAGLVGDQIYQNGKAQASILFVDEKQANEYQILWKGYAQKNSKMLYEEEGHSWRLTQSVSNSKLPSRFQGVWLQSIVVIGDKELAMLCLRSDELSYDEVTSLARLFESSMQVSQN